MKFILNMILCSSINGTCLEPYPMPNHYNDLHSCLIGGYKESITKRDQIGSKDVNEHKMFIKFYCEEIEKKGINA